MPALEKERPITRRHPAVGVPRGVARGHHGCLGRSASAGEPTPLDAALRRGAVGAHRRPPRAGAGSCRRHRQQRCILITGRLNRIRGTSNGRSKRHSRNASLRGNPLCTARPLASMAPVRGDTRRARSRRMQHRSQNPLHGGRTGGADPEHGGRPRFRRRVAIDVHQGRVPPAHCRRGSRRRTGLSGSVGWRQRRRVRGGRAQRMVGLGDPARIRTGVGGEHRRHDRALCFSGPELRRLGA